MRVTSAIANKMLKQLEEEKTYWTTKESTSRYYVASINEDPVIPDYDYIDTTQKIVEIDEKIVKIKHAINLTNINTVVSINGVDMTIDQILISMAQKNKRKTILEQMRTHPPVARVKSDFYNHNASVPEYEYINYNMDCVKADYEYVSSEIVAMQLVLDKHNQTFEFDIDL